jgi:sigma-B regulation protein RsbU (phosphoserine phosphatase)
MFCAVVDTKTGHMEYCQAGYPSPTYVNPDGQSQLIGQGGFPVGMFPHFTYDNSAMLFEERGMLVLCSDAATEAENSLGDPFGIERLNALIAENHLTEIDDVPEKVVEKLLDWRSSQPLEDDLTVVALTRIQNG